ncbi:sigma-70 family RNA polymerase sigma factor [Kitasatospora sp. NPDC094015]|uniref:sigma-70 family RNA polymerase sigma factor n=1 Tax=Kitasatospora sp. NPDC094015 TaxID=3155205 RepID=UPI00331F9C34
MNRAVDSDHALVERARGGDRQATAELLTGHLPLVYNIVGRALSGHADTDDVVQETMLRAVDGLSGLRDPGGFRSWLVAIAMNQVRRRYRDALPAGPDEGLHSAYEVPDPGADFVGLTIVRLGLSEQRREVAEATRWLDESERELLALWWQEAAGELTRAELAAAAGLSPQHAAVRVQRVKEQLETARLVVRALAVSPRCWQLAELTSHWDGIPSALWRKRITRHLRECGFCAQAQHGLMPAEGLLAGMAMVPLPNGYGDYLGLDRLADLASSGGNSSSGHGDGSDGGSHGGQGGGSGGAHRGRRRPKPTKGRTALKVLGAAVLTATVAGVTAHLLPAYPPRQDSTGEAASATQLDLANAPGPAADPSTAAPSSAAPSASTAGPSADPSASPSAAPSSKPAAPPASPSSKPAAPSTAAPKPPSGDTVQQVLDLVNTERSKAGCGAVKANAQLASAAQKHSDDMAARGFFDHTNPDGAGPQPRIEAAGYKWSTWGENIARGQQDAAAVMDAWMHSDGHRANILNCAFTELGVGVHTGKGGPWWTQDFGAPPR